MALPIPEPRNIEDSKPGSAFHDDLVEHDLIIPAGPLGVFGRRDMFEDVLRRLDDLIVETAGTTLMEEMTFPPVIDRSIIERTGYMESFPTLCGSVHSFEGHET